MVFGFFRGFADNSEKVKSHQLYQANLQSHECGFSSPNTDGVHSPPISVSFQNVP